MGLHLEVATAQQLTAPQLGAGQLVGDAGVSPSSGAANTGAGSVLAVAAAPAPRNPYFQPLQGTGIDWKGLTGATLTFIVAQNAFRLAKEPGTREGMKGPFFQGYLDSLGNMHGWADGDEFYVNYVGHPMQGAASGYIWTFFDRDYTTVQFGKDPRYWKSRLRATAFSWAYSAAFEIGPVSEASIGKVQKFYPAQGFVDHVTTPLIGFAWMIGEDALDRKVIQPFEMRVENPMARLVVRGVLNPARSWANVMRWKVPWARDDRPGVFKSSLTPFLQWQHAHPYIAPKQPSREFVGPYGVSVFEFNGTFVVNTFAGSQDMGACPGGGGDAAIRFAPQWMLAVDVDGCKLMGLSDKNLSGDTLFYAAGPRWTPRPAAKWSPYAHFLLGGMKVTQERMFPALKQQLVDQANGEISKMPHHNEYTVQFESNALAFSAGGGLDLRLTPAVAVRVAGLEYRKSWNPVMNGLQFNDGLTFSSSLVIRMGTW